MDSKGATGSHLNSCMLKMCLTVQMHQDHLAEMKNFRSDPRPIELKYVF